MNKTFCVLPFVNVCTERSGELQACQQSERFSKTNAYSDDISLGWNDEYFKELRLDLLNGVENPNCFRCWQANERGIESKRTNANAIFKGRIEDPEFIQEIENCKNNNGHFNLMPEQLDIKINNTCNLKCMMCNPYQSSQHVSEVKMMRKKGIEVPSWIQFIETTLGDKIKPPKGKLSDNLKKIIKQVDRLLIDGGEPLSSPDLGEVLDYCIEEGYTNLGVSFVTNLTNISDGILNKLNQFDNVGLFLSWDHLDADYFKFIRYPADYNLFLKHFDEICRYKNIKLGISFAVSIFNVYDVFNILDHFEKLTQEQKLQLEVMFKLVHLPEYLCVEFLEPEQKQELDKMFDEYLLKNSHYTILQNPSTLAQIKDIKELLTYSPDNFLSVVTERTKVLNMYDTIRNTDHHRLFPFIKKYE
jgi:MoaA/NifB/PqqE/SkfB family radical SAM enzyme